MYGTFHKFMINVINQIVFDSEKYTNIYREFFRSAL